MAPIHAAGDTTTAIFFVLMFIIFEYFKKIYVLFLFLFLFLFCYLFVCVKNEAKDILYEKHFKYINKIQKLPYYKL